MVYVDGFLLTVPKKNLAIYRRIATAAGKVWMEHGALEYRECLGDDLETKGMLSFEKVSKARSGETVFFSFIVYKSRAHRDAVNKKVMSDKRIHKMMANKKVPFDVKRMAYGGFKSVVDLSR